MLRLLSKFFQSEEAYGVLWLISFVWILIAVDQPITLGAVIAAALVAIAAAWMIGILIGLPVVLLDIITDIISSVHRDIRAASDKTTDRCRPLP